MARVGEVDLKYQAINQAKANLLHQLRRSIEPSFDAKDLADALDSFVDAKIAAALDRRY